MSRLEKESLWNFSKIPGIEESTFNKVLEKFYDLGISGLVRENVQNSLDGKLPECNEAVVVTIKTGQVKSELVPGINEIRERISCLQGRNGYTKETIAYMQNKMIQEDISYISFEDYNTKGLTGAKNGQSNCAKDTWGIYAYNKGVHFEENDSNVEKSRGGSHGIGKIASNAASDLYMMYFANCDAEGNQHLGGTVQLVEHKYKDNFYRSTGYFTKVEQIDEDTTKFYPFENTFGEIFEKKTRGLKIVIPFLREQFNNEKEIIKSICDSFFIAILEKKLEVIVNDKRINEETIKDYILNEEYYVQDIGDIKEEFTPLYFNTYKNTKVRSIGIKDYDTEYKFKLYFDYDERIQKGRTGIIRTIGMKIEDKKIKGNVNKPYNAVLIPESITEDAFLKSLENESHTELTSEHIKDQKLQKSAKRFINNISKEIAKIIEGEMNKNNPTDGKMDTNDLLYVVENQFKQDLSKSMEKVKIKKNNKENEIVKVEFPASTGGKKDKDKEKKPRKKRPAKPVKKPESPDEENTREKNVRFVTNPDMVERLIIQNNEYIKFDFSNTDEIKKVKYCDIELGVLDGNGDESKDKFILKDNYAKVVDRSTQKECKIENNKIVDVKIVKNVAEIKIDTTKKYNRALKFVYYVEV